jgi:3-oxoacyl-[acyl-carrier-protein] synthase-3
VPPTATSVPSPLAAGLPTPTGRGAAIAAVASSLPSNVVVNADIAPRLGVDESWITRRTGIAARRIATAEDRLTDHAARAATDALKKAGVDPRTVDLVLVATTTSDEILPNAAPLVAHAIGAEHAGAFDVGAACTGFLSALAAGAAMIEGGRFDCAVVVGADFMSRITEPTDRGTAAVFADGAGAAVLVATDGATRIGPVVLGSRGDDERFITVPRDDARIYMQGHETFREAVMRLSESTLEAAEAAGLALDEIDVFVYHQANGRILSAVAERLALPIERVVDCIAEHGNTSAATLPLALAHADELGQLQNGARVLLGAFGAGFTWGATVVEWGEP